ncbi:MAG TPA: ATP-binding protein [Gemmatimonadales bacterium]|nr:ATP-binding protein [Gemmatimonadales bacterium]
MKAPLGRWVRWGWLATTIALGAALVVTAWVGRERAVAAATTLNRGQSLVLLESIRQQARGLAEPLQPGQLDTILRQHQAAGLSYLAFFDSTGSPIAQAGRPTVPVRLPVRRPPGPPVLEQIGDRVRLWGYAGLAPPPPEGAGTAPARAGGPPAGAARPRRLAFVMEFEPLVAERLAGEATSTFALSLLMAAALIAAAVVFWRLTVRQEHIERRLEEQRRLGALGEMSAVLAHELRNPLASLKGNAQLLAERLGARSPDRGKADLVVTEARRLEALTSDLLDFARSGPMDLQPTDPAALLSACVDEVGRDGFVVRAEGTPHVWPLDERRMRQALTNVLRNARQATPEGTRPEVAAGRSDGSLVFTVRDFGAGVPAGDERKIFSPFYTTRVSGTGLGLAVAQRVVELHGGTIVAANHPDGGAVFRITLPGR